MAQASTDATPGPGVPGRSSVPTATPKGVLCAILRLYRGTQAIGTDLWVLFAVLFAAGAVSGPARTLLPVYLERNLAWAPPAIAALSSARLLTAALSALLGGALADSAGPRRALQLGLTGLPLAALLFLTAAAPALVPLILTVGLTDGFQSTGSQSYLVTRASRATIGRATSAFFLGGTLGGALGNLVAGALLGGWGFASLGWIGLGSGLLVLAAAQALPADSGTAAKPRSLTRTIAGYRPLLAVPRVRQLALLRFLTTCSWGTSTFLWPLLIARISGDPATAALFGTVSLTLAAGAQLGIGRLIDARGPAVPAAVLATIVPLLAVLSALAVAANALPAIFVIGVIGTCAAWSLSGTIPPLIYATAPPEQAGQVVGLLHLLWSLAMLAGTLLAGWLVTLNPALPFWTIALLGIPAIIAAYRLQRALRPGLPHA